MFYLSKLAFLRVFHQWETGCKHQRDRERKREREREREKERERERERKRERERERNRWEAWCMVSERKGALHVLVLFVDMRLPDQSSF